MANIVAKSNQDLYAASSEDELNAVVIQNETLNVANLQNGPFLENQRECKDLFCFFFYWLNTVAMIALSTWAYFTGEPKNIYRATDSLGNICGKEKSALQKYRYAYFFNPTNYKLSNRVCLQFCPKWNSGTLQSLECYPNGPNCTVNVTISESGVSSTPLSANGFYFIGYQSKMRLDRICLPNKYVLSGPFQPYSRNIANELIQSSLLDFVSDVQNNYPWLFIMGSIAIVFSIIFWFGFKFISQKMIWVSLFLCFALFIIIGVVFLYNGGALTASDQQGRLGIPTSVDRNFYAFYGGFTLCFASIIVIIIICCFYQMYPLYEMMKIATKFISQVPTSMIIVVQMTIMMSLFWMTSVSSMIYALSASEFNAQGKVFSSVTGQYDRGIIMLYYFIFNALWTHEIFISTMTFGVSTIFSMWYFVKSPQQLDKPMLRTLQMIMRYHFGSLVFGSLILLLIQFLEYFMELFFFIHQWKYRNSNSCFKCIDTVTNYMYRFSSRITSRFNRFAYIQIGLRGKDFMKASKDGCLLIQYKKRSFGLLYGLNSIICFIIKVSIALLPTTIFYLFSTFWEYAETSILQPIYFVLIIFYYSLGVASVIIGSYTAIIDTLISCYVIDEINQKRKSLKPKYAPKEIKTLFQLIS